MSDDLPEDEGRDAESQQPPLLDEPVAGATAGEQQSQPGGTKTCPMCAEEVKAAALVCRFCGHQFKDLLPIPPRPSGPPPDDVTVQLRPGEELFVWSRAFQAAADGVVAITTDRILFLWHGRADFQYPINRCRKVTVGGKPMMAGCRPDGTVRFEFDDGAGLEYAGMNPEVAKEVGATVASGLIDKLFPNDAAMQQTLRDRHERISARASALAPKTAVTVKHCQFLGGVSGKVTTGSGSLVFSPRSIKYMQWRMEMLSFENAQWSNVAVYGAQEMQRLTATRMLTLGVFSLAAPKRQVNSFVVRDPHEQGDCRIRGEERLGYGPASSAVTLARRALGKRKLSSLLAVVGG